MTKTNKEINPAALEQSAEVLQSLCSSFRGSEPQVYSTVPLLVMQHLQTLSNTRDLLPTLNTYIASAPIIKHFFFLISTFTLFTPFNTKLAFKYRSHTNAKCDPGVLSVIHSQHVISDHSSYLVLTQTFQMWQHSISFSNSVGWKVSLYPLVECLCCFRGVEKVCFPVGSDAQTSRVAQGECDSSGIKFSLNVLERHSLLGQARTRKNRILLPSNFMPSFCDLAHRSTRSLS